MENLRRRVSKNCDKMSKKEWRGEAKRDETRHLYIVSLLQTHYSGLNVRFILFYFITGGRVMARRGATLPCKNFCWGLES